MVSPPVLSPKAELRVDEFAQSFKMGMTYINDWERAVRAVLRSDERLCNG